MIKKVITFYDNAAIFKDEIPSQKEMNRFYYYLLTWVKDNPEYLIILKAKRDDYLKYLGKQELSLVEDLRDKGTLIVRQKHADLKSGLMADIVVGVSATSLVLLSAAYGRPAVLLDEHNVFTDYPPDIDNLTIIDNPADIGGAIRNTLNEKLGSAK